MSAQEASIFWGCNSLMDQTFALTPGTALTIDAKDSTARKDAPDSIAFVANISRLEGAKEFILAPGHILRRATTDEIEIIKGALAGVEGGLFGLRFFPWEYRKEPSGALTPLPEEEWEYFVIAFRGSNAGIVTLEQVFCISDVELKVGFVAGSWPPGTGTGLPARIYHLGRLFQILNNEHFGTRPESYSISQDAANQISCLFKALKSHDPETMNMERIAGQLLELEELRSGSTSQFLGYFGILESLLTHRPDPKDPYDSITRQVKKKIALLDHRWSPPIDYGSFGESKPEVVWGKMYAYRSYLAHGDFADFKTGELNLLGSAENAMNLLRSTVKAIARLALSEPLLISDLKNC